jgi:hypothetical protein
MPDIQSELTKVFDHWEEDAKTFQPDLQPKEQLKMKSTPTAKSLSETVFHYVLNNPSQTTMHYVTALEKLGHNRGSTTSLLSQMVRNCLLNKDLNGLLTPASTKYRPLKKLPSTRKMKARKQITIKRVERVAPPVVQPAPKAGIESLYSKGIDNLRVRLVESINRGAVPTAWSPESIMDTLTRGQAKELHTALAKAFNLGEGA